MGLYPFLLAETTQHHPLLLPSLAAETSLVLYDPPHPFPMLFRSLRFTIPAPGGLCITCASQENHQLPPHSPQHRGHGREGLTPPDPPRLSPFRLAIGSVLCEFQLHYVVDTNRADGLDQLLVSRPLRGREASVSSHSPLQDHAAPTPS